MMKISEAAKARGIEYLVHFTRIENLPCIINQNGGLKSRALLHTNGISYIFNDEQRLDGFENSISLSVTFPNYRMFYKYRQIYGNYCVILLNAEKIFSNLNLAFHRTNAASSEVRDIPIEQRKTLAAFNSMFYEPLEYSRSMRGLNDNEATDPQAEILCFDSIPLDYFEKIIFPGYRTLQANAPLFEDSGILCEVDSNYFAPRHDWNFWKGANY